MGGSRHWEGSRYIYIINTTDILQDCLDKLHAFSDFVLYNITLQCMYVQLLFC